jgi:hypothetical protein
MKTQSLERRQTLWRLRPHVSHRLQWSPDAETLCSDRICDLEQCHSMDHLWENHHIGGAFTFRQSMPSRFQQLSLGLQIFFISVQSAFSVLQPEHSLISTDYLKVSGFWLAFQLVTGSNKRGLCVLQLECQRGVGIHGMLKGMFDHSKSRGATPQNPNLDRASNTLMIPFLLTEALALSYADYFSSNWGIEHLAMIIIFLVTEALSTQRWKWAKWDVCDGLDHILWYWIHVVIYVKDLRALKDR